MINEIPTAFPWTHRDTTCTGMTLRDYFAARALPSCYQYWINDMYHPDCTDAAIRNEQGRMDLTDIKELIAEDAYALADAMIKAREQE